MTPRGGPTLDFSLFGRYFLDLAIFYPGAFLCLAPLWEHVKAPRRTAVLTAALVTVICLAAAALCAIFELDSNILLLPTLLAAFWLLRWRVGPEVSVSQTAFLFAVSGVMMAVCSLLSVVLNARAEVGNDAPACLVSTSLLKLGLSAVLCIIFWFTAVQWSRWLLREYRGEAFWQSAWPLPTIYAAFLVFCMPLDPAVVLINRLMIISVLAVTISLLGIFLLLYEMYQVAREYTRSAQLDRENQLLAVESRRYTELRAYMEQTRHLRHDFRQHLHVIAGLTEAGQVDELKNYLHQYESELSEERPTLCANPAVDALAGHLQNRYICYEPVTHQRTVAFFVSILSISGTPLLPRRTAKAVWPQDVSPYRRWTPVSDKRSSSAEQSIHLTISTVRTDSADEFHSSVSPVLPVQAGVSP